MNDDSVVVRQDKNVKKQAKKAAAPAKAAHVRKAPKDRSAKADKDAGKRGPDGKKVMRTPRGTARAKRRANSSYFYLSREDNDAGRSVVVAKRTGRRNAAPVGARVVYAQSEVEALLMY